MVSPAQPQERNGMNVPGDGQSLSEIERLVIAIINLAPFDRFVFVISTLEQYSDREAAVILSCSGQEIKAARTRAVQNIVVNVTHAPPLADAAVVKEKLASVLRWPLRPQPLIEGDCLRG